MITEVPLEKPWERIFPFVVYAKKYFTLISSHRNAFISM